MIESLKQWIINICTAVFFITAVEMILPNNSLKKYAKFVLGLILITVLINPIIKIFHKNFDINVYSKNIYENFDKSKHQEDLQEYKKNTLDNTVEVFKSNIESLCENKLKEKYPNEKYKVSAKVQFDEGKEKFFINKIDVLVKSNKIEKIKKVKIDSKDRLANTSNNTEILNNEKGKNIKKYLSDELKVSKDIIIVRKL
ncbi:stage III sporulation protein SpoIIIAF [Clostridium acetireducens DSM 10703]|uniref:Stage III sporulation protein SpoIIIAF n=1 Tax=Clostridium acetireducens DSM 10703 TaxID=1121290 RepID=A0A1E8F232_9CLOT|nr:stage III sporulation protein AF [Clostridium acetireducens]OFI07592.1 stage III sporulation protein SpoIIIAF [Clostridium acetireducens DSM 10703]